MIARCLAILLVAAAGTARAQGFAGLGTEAEGFALPERGAPITFPEDHGAHPEFRIEWWYLTANLQAADGARYGVQWTLFRTALAPREADGWQSPQLWMGHAALTTASRHHHAERLARGGVGQAGVTAEPFAAWIDDWRAAGPSLSEVTVTASGRGFGYALDLDAEGPFVFHGENGFSVKSAEGQASHYYSQPFYRARGTLSLEGREVAVTGTAWLDREWSSQPLSESQEGWDWFSISLDGGARVMAAQVRETGGGVFTFATWIAPDGTETPYGDGALRLTPLGTAEVAGREVPVRWRVELPAKGLDVTTEPLNPQSWMATSFPYWEGPVSVSGSHDGHGYLEMTGYE
ncbi:lipocalin-like domain-containing protein [Rhodosalinus sp. K401]|uniref:lipocalin-like domain-containing protein n=1 Tax=Rhodosalinus sp. K401 TaxID=3239195 RepID=UPI003523411C